MAPACKPRARQPRLWDRTAPGSAVRSRRPIMGFSAPTDPPVNRTTRPLRLSQRAAPTLDDLPVRDNGSKSTAATGLLSNRYYSGCYASMVKANTDWHPVRTGSSASCGSLRSNDCQCTGAGSNSVCAFDRPTDQTGSRSRKGRAAVAAVCYSPVIVSAPAAAAARSASRRPTTHPWRPSPTTAWDGCVRDRNQSFDAECPRRLSRRPDVRKQTSTALESY